ncbi:MAG: Hpt domain-containing protein [Pseudomonadota bacterium]
MMNRDKFALDWIRGELDNTLDQARQALETYAEGGREETRLRSCLTQLHQVHGTLKMLELDAVTQLAEHMERTAQALLNGSIHDARMGEQVLMQSILQLPVFIEEIQRNGVDDPSLVMPYINELRSCCGESALVMDAGDPEPLSAAEVAPVIARFRSIDGQEKSGRIRKAYQQVMLMVLQRRVDADTLDRLTKVAISLERICEGAPVATLWRALRLFAKSIGDMPAYLCEAASLDLLRRIDNELRSLAGDGEAVLSAPLPAALTRDLLRETERRGAARAEVAEIEAAVGTPAAQRKTPRPREALEQAATVIREELSGVRDKLDMFVRAGSTDTQELLDVTEPLDRMASTLALLGERDLESIMQSQRQTVREMAAENRVDESVVLGVASALLRAEEELGSDAGVAPAERAIAPQIFSGAQLAVLQEARGGIDHVKQCVVDFVANNWDTGKLEDVPGLLQAVEGALAMVPLEELAGLLSGCRAYLTTRLLAGHQPDGQELDAFADALSGIDYSLERLFEAGGGNQVFALDAVRERLQTLGIQIDAPAASAALAVDSGDDAPEADAGDFELQLDDDLAADDTQPTFADRAIPTLDAVEPVSEETPPLSIEPAEPSTAAPLVSAEDSEPTDELTFELEALDDEPQPGDASAGPSVFDLPDDLPADLPSELPDEQPVAVAEHPAAFDAAADDFGDFELIDPEDDAEPPRLDVVDFAPEPATPPNVREAPPPVDVEPFGLADIDAIPSQLETQAQDAAFEMAVDDAAADAAAPEVTEPTLEPMLEPISESRGPDDEIIEVFCEEVDEVLETLEAALPNWSANLADADTLGEIRRGFHTLKGSGRMVGAQAIGELGWAVENMLNRVLEGTLSATEDHLLLVGRACTTLRDLRDLFATNNGEPTSASLRLIEDADVLASGGTLQTQLAEPSPADESPVFSESALDGEATAPDALDEEDFPIFDDTGFDDLPETPEAAPTAAPRDELVALPPLFGDSEPVDAGQTSTEEPLAQPEPPAPSAEEVFAAEAQEHLGVLQAAIARSFDGGELSLSSEFARALHTIAGSASTAQERDVAAIAESMQDVCTAVMRGGAERLDGDNLAFVREGVYALEKRLSGNSAAGEIAADDEVGLFTAEAQRLLAQLWQTDAPDAPGTVDLAAADALVDAAEFLANWRDGKIDLDATDRMRAALTSVQANQQSLSLTHLADVITRAYDAWIDAPLSSARFNALLAAHQDLLLALDALAAEQPAPGVASSVSHLESLLDEPQPEEPAAMRSDSLANLLDFEDDFARPSSDDLDLGALAVDDEDNFGFDSGEFPIDPPGSPVAAASADAGAAPVESEDEQPPEAVEAMPFDFDDSFDLSDLGADIDDDEDRAPEFDAAASAPADPEEEDPLGFADFTPASSQTEASAEPIDPEILDIFFEEAEEICELLDHALHNWQSDPRDAAPLDTLLRGLHTLKGGARLAGLPVYGDQAHEFESRLIELKNAPDAIDADSLATVQVHHDELVVALARIRETGADLPLRPEGDVAAGTETPDEAPIQSAPDETPAPSAADAAPVTLTPMWDDADAEDAADALIDHVDADEPEEAEAGEWPGEPAFAPVDSAQETPAEVPAGAPIDAPDEAFDEAAAALDDAPETAALQAAADAAAVLAIDDEVDNIETVELDGETEEDWVLEGLEAPQPEGASAVSLPQPEAPGFSADPGDDDRDRGGQEKVRVASNLLEELVNLAGEASITRARIEQGISDFSGALEEMEVTIDRVREQLRRLEIETESRLTSGGERLMGPEDEEFDPLEMDRYSQMQQLTRSLTESATDMLDLKETLRYRTREAETLLLQQARLNTELQEGLMRTRMVPFSRLMPRLRRIVRQVSTEVGKQIEFHAYNAEGELDRSVLERMVPPLEHMLRNAIDHGIEAPEMRHNFGKPTIGRINLKLSREGGDVVIEISDDGAGIDVENVRAKAIERGLMAHNAQLADEQVLEFILAPGFSTAKALTQISGRGVGMDVVHSEVQQLGGEISIASTPGKGTTFTVRLPFTVSVNRALMVTVGEDRYAIGLNTIEGIVLLNPSELETLRGNDAQMFEYAGVPYRVRYLGDYLGRELTQQRLEQTNSVPVVLVRSGDRSVALHVDSVQGSREIVVKSLGPQFAGVGGISGATILGDGSVVVILDLHALMRSRSPNKPEQPPRVENDSTRWVLVVDDSVTVRKVTSRLLERQGMNVMVAKDGVEAVAQLQERRPDIILLDIEMPRMDGFEVARQVRHDPWLAELPIIMISSRTGQKHQDRARELGVNRTLGKPFQENELLELIDELISEKAH